ncbi:MAG: hypothetical protein FJ112_05005 [Deltaproteobacteria bacterium]|nr:hypothetical protein [Deltaproteobacteria bacterium]
MKIPSVKKLNEKGQSAIEFIVVVVVVFFFLLFYLSFSITLVASEYVDYATFMAARTYKSGNIDRDSQEEAARRVFTQYLSPVESIIRKPQLTFSPTNVPFQTEGVTATYEVDLFYLPPVFIKDGSAPPSRLPLSSQTLLGRDPPLTECLNFFQSFVGAMGLNVGNTFLVNLMDDNGC